MTIYQQNPSKIPLRQASFYSAGNYKFKVSNRNTRTRCEICSKLTIKTQERRHWLCCSVFIVNYEYIPPFVLVFLLFNFEHVNAGWKSCRAMDIAQQLYVLNQLRSIKVNN